MPGLNLQAEIPLTLVLIKEELAPQTHVKLQGLRAPEIITQAF